MIEYDSPELNNAGQSNNKNMIYCKSCGLQYSKKIKKCPNCGKRNTKPFYCKWWFWVIIIIFAIGAATTDKDSNTSSTSNKANPAVEEIVITEDEYKSQCSSISYNDIARNPNDYIGKMATFRGKVIQVQENGKNVVLRINVTQGQYGLWEDTIYVDYQRKNDNESRVLEDDIVTIYGEIKGIKSYKAVLGNQISIPHIKAEYIDIN